MSRDDDDILGLLVLLGLGWAGFKALKAVFGERERRFRVREDTLGFKRGQIITGSELAEALQEEVDRREQLNISNLKKEKVRIAGLKPCPSCENMFSLNELCNHCPSCGKNVCNDCERENRGGPYHASEDDKKYGGLCEKCISKGFVKCPSCQSVVSEDDLTQCDRGTCPKTRCPKCPNSPYCSLHCQNEWTCYCT